MGKVIVTDSIFNENVDVNDKELLKKRLEFLENEMIIPPKNLKVVIDKTAEFVKKNGKIFEIKIYKEKEKQFGFINVGHPYFYYYQYKMHELYLNLKEKEIIPKAVLEIKKKEDINKSNNKEHILKICDLAEKKETNMYALKDEIKKEKYDEKLIEIKDDIFTITYPFISSVDIDIIKVTALFVARNGNKFLNELIEREKNNSQYDFLRANNLYFNFFSQLIDIYIKCLVPNEYITDKIKKYSENRKNILNYCYSLYNNNMKKKNEEEKKIQDKNVDTYYDWNNFIVVEKIEFNENIESLPYSIDFTNIENYVLKELFDTDKKLSNIEKINNLSYHMKNIENNVLKKEDYFDIDNSFDMNKNILNKENIDEHDVKDNLINKNKEIMNNIKNQKEKEKEMEKEKEKENVNKMIIQEEIIEDEENEEKIIVVKNYEKTRKHKLQKQDNIHLCPITNKPININDMTKHLKTLLLDPKWKEQKDKLYEKAKKDSSFQPYEDIEESLSQFVINRPDIFGSIDEELKEHDSNDIITKNYQKEIDVYSYIQNIYNQMIPQSLYLSNSKNESFQDNFNKKQKQ